MLKIILNFHQYFLVIVLFSSSVYINYAYSLTDDFFYPYGSKINGSSYEDWAIKYWQWYVTIPKSLDLPKEKCFLNDDFAVLFLVNPIAANSAPSKTISYDCIIPSNKPIFINGISEICKIGGNVENKVNVTMKTDTDISTCLYYRNYAAEIDVKLDDLVKKIPQDKNLAPLGESPKIIERHSEFSKTVGYFNLAIPKDTKYGDQGLGTDKAKVDIKFLILKPLPIGDHSLTWHIVQMIPEDRLSDLNVLVNYNLHVQ